MTTAALFRDDSLTAVYIQVHDINTITALDPIAVVGTASLTEESLNRLRHDLKSRVLRTCQASCSQGMDRYQAYLMIKTLVPMHFGWVYVQTGHIWVHHTGGLHTGG